jgi:hypothetical protein
MMFNKKTVLRLCLVGAFATLSACSDDGTDGANGSNGMDGVDGNSGLDSLIQQTALFAGDTRCFKGGTQFDSGLDLNSDTVLSSDEVTDTSYVCNSNTVNTAQNFNRIASFAVCSQINIDCDDDTETSAEIVAASTDGLTLIYSDSPQEVIGFVDITQANAPVALGTANLSGEPTSVSVLGDYAVVGVNTSVDFVNTSGVLEVFDIASRTSVVSFDVGGQPDSVAVSPDGNYIAVVIENERDEDLGDGVPPQLPAGMLVIVDASADTPIDWTTNTVELTGIATLYSDDPEPEFVDINNDNIAVVTLQENNHIILVDLTTGTITNDFSAGSVNLTAIDTEEQDSAIISLTSSQDNVLREPDGVSWINTDYFVTADEGDLDGGSRGFTIFNTSGEVVYSSGNTLDHLAVRLGHYPDDRSGNKGNEPENVEVGIYGDDRYLFVNSERSSLIFVFDVADPTQPVYKQTLPAAKGPEGGLAIPSRNLLAVASEVDDRSDKLRSVVNLYNYTSSDLSYPTVMSADRVNGTPIPWGAMSGLAADLNDEDILYAVDDSFYGANRVFVINVDDSPAVIEDEIYIKDNNDVFSAFVTSGASEDADSFDDVDLALMINADKTVNLDPEGITVRAQGGFFIASEGAGTIGDTDSRPIEKLNFLFALDSTGVIEKVISLPDSVNDIQVRFGFEGVAEYDGAAYVAFQRAWGDESSPRIGIYDYETEAWSFLFYPLDAAESQNAGWVGLSDIISLGDGEFMVIERDNQGGPDAAIKRLYSFDVTGLTDGAAVTKNLVRDLMDDLAVAGGLTPEKIEGLALQGGNIYIINDNDGVDDNSGETQLINLGDIL